ncbi:MAG: MFS transporter [Myxococcales bacterium]|nr:MFS transporter [Myxococcales bacterium]
MIFPLLPLFLIGTVGVTPVFLGVVEGAADVVSSALKLIAGRLSDRVGARKPLIMVGYGLAGAVRPLMAFAAAPWHVLLIRLTDRVGKGVRGAPRDALIADAAEEGQAARAFGFHRGMDHAGAVVGPLIAAALLASGMSLRTVFLCAAVPGVLAFATTAMLKERPPTNPGPGGPSVGPTGDVLAGPVALPAGFWRLLGVFALFGLGNSSDAFLLLRARDLGVADASIPLLWSFFHVSKVGWSAFGGWLGDALPRRTTIIAGWVVYGCVYLLFGVATASWQAWALFGAYGAYFGLTEPVEKALVRDVVPAALRGTAYGWYGVVTGAMALPASLLVGGLWGFAGPAVALGVGAGLAMLAAGLLAALPAALPAAIPIESRA